MKNEKKIIHVRKSENIKHKKITSGLKDVEDGNIKKKLFFFFLLHFSYCSLCSAFSSYKEDLETKFGENPMMSKYLLIHFCSFLFFSFFLFFLLLAHILKSLYFDVKTWEFFFILFLSVRNWNYVWRLFSI